MLPIGRRNHTKEGLDEMLQRIVDRRVNNEKRVGTMHSVHGGSYTELENLQKYVSYEMKWRDAILEELNSRSFEN
jgi:hypothetical protein